MVDEAHFALPATVPSRVSTAILHFPVGPSQPFLKHGWTGWIFPSGAPERWFCRELHVRAHGGGNTPHTYPQHSSYTGNSIPGPSRKFTSLSAPRCCSTANGIGLPVGHTPVLHQHMDHKRLSIRLSELFLQFNLPWFPGQQTGSRKSGKCLTHGFLET